jgi:hypothetical protein
MNRVSTCWALAPLPDRKSFLAISIGISLDAMLCGFRLFRNEMTPESRNLKLLYSVSTHLKFDLRLNFDVRISKFDVSTLILIEI